MLMTYETDGRITSYSVRSCNAGETKDIYSFKSTATSDFYPLSAAKEIVVNPENEDGKAVIMYSDGKEYEARMVFDYACNAVIAETEDGFF